jgi:hypothetical protein
MKLILRIALCCSLAACMGVAQRRGGGGGGFTSGGFHGGGTVSRGGYGGGMGGGVSRGGFGGGVYRGGYGGIYRGNGGFYGGYYRPYYGYGAFGFGLGFGLGYGYGYSPWYSDYGYSSYYPAYTSYPAYQAGYSNPAYQPSPNVTVVYPPQASAPASNPVYGERSVTREYDQYGQEINRPAAPANAAPAVYLIAFRDHTIHAAAAYWADRGTLHYVTLDHEEKLVPLNTVDRDLSAQLNRERRVAFSLPASH